MSDDESRLRGPTRHRRRRASHRARWPPRAWEPWTWTPSSPRRPRARGGARHGQAGLRLFRRRFASFPETTDSPRRHARGAWLCLGSRRLRSFPPPPDAPRSAPSRAGAETETTLRANAAAYASVRLWPRCLVDVSDVDTRCADPTLVLRTLAAPLIVAPVAMQKMAHPDGECAAARACASAGIAYCASQQSTTPVERPRRGRRRHPMVPTVRPRRLRRPCEARPSSE